jgi:multiple RNA-binding domain-containing protein 1
LQLTQVHIPTDSKGSGKGFAYVVFIEATAAIQAYKELDRIPFQGRLLHIIPATAKKANHLDEYAISKLPLKKQKQIRLKAEASSSTFNWNSMYMNVSLL